MSDKLVTVIITTYKGSDSIRRAIESVINQTYKNLEIIVVDDNGKGTIEQVATQRIAEEYSDITYIAHEHNMNGSAARNTGIFAAKGSIIELLDDDDEFLPEKTSQQLQRMLDTNTDVCYAGHKVIFQTGVERDYKPNLEGFIFSEILCRKVEAPTSVLMFTKDAALTINGFDKSFRRHQDWEFLDRLSMNNRISCVSNICLLRHIVDRNVARNTKQFVENRLYYLNKQKPLIDMLNQKQKDELYYYHYSEIMRNYLKSHDFLNAIKWFVKAGHPFRLIIESIRKYKQYLNRI